VEEGRGGCGCTAGAPRAARARARWRRAPTGAAHTAHSAGRRERHRQGRRCRRCFCAAGPRRRAAGPRVAGAISYEKPRPAAARPPIGAPTRPGAAGGRHAAAHGVGRAQRRRVGDLLLRHRRHRGRVLGAARAHAGCSRLGCVEGVCARRAARGGCGAAGAGAAVKGGAVGGGGALTGSNRRFMRGARATRAVAAVAVVPATTGRRQRRWQRRRAHRAGRGGGLVRAPAPRPAPACMPAARAFAAAPPSRRPLCARPRPVHRQDRTSPPLLD
jgi:hypothetical protein